MRLQCGDNFLIVLGALPSPSFDGDGSQSALASRLKPRSVSQIRDDNADARIGNVPLLDSLSDSKKVRPTTREQNTQVVHQA
jgi:hypothetical protein